jgi:tRNA(fMet)-specific endonuclease VapC
MRRSLKLESLGAGYRYAHFMASWAGNHWGTCRRHTRQQLAVTIITMEEVLGGWYTQIRQARDDQQLARAYQALHEAIEFSRSIRILPFDLPEIRRYRQLRTQHRRIGTNDLRIAAIVLEQRGILVTRNTNDFADITGLQLDDWA